MRSPPPTPSFAITIRFLELFETRLISKWMRLLASIELYRYIVAHSHQSAHRAPSLSALMKRLQLPSLRRPTPCTHRSHTRTRGKHRLQPGYTSLLSVTYGPASEAEAERGALRKNFLIAMGDWVDTDSRYVRPLKGAVRARERQQICRMSKHKKPVVVPEQGVHAQQYGPAPGYSGARALLLSTPPSYGSMGKFISSVYDIDL
jgi:hypothetical protein